MLEIKKYLNFNLCSDNEWMLECLNNVLSIMNYSEENTSRGIFNWLFCRFVYLYVTWLSGARHVEQTLRLYVLWNTYQLNPDKPIGQAKKEIWPGSFVLIFLCLSTYKIEILSMWTTMYTKVFASWPLKMCIVCILAHSESLFLNFNNKVG